MSKILFKRNDQGNESGDSEIKKSESKSLGFSLFFLGIENQNVQVIETNEIDFEAVKLRLENGQSVFIDTIQSV
ncbi:MAG: hypothetical protein P8Y79_15930 [Ignavibacteriaceae bacterium]